MIARLSMVAPVRGAQGDVRASVLRRRFRLQ
jgi:hypothetical protein